MNSLRLEKQSQIIIFNQNVSKHLITLLMSFYCKKNHLPSFYTDIITPFLQVY